MNREQQMRSLYESFLIFKGSMKSFCLANNVNLYTFKYWQKKFRHKPKSGFVRIEPVTLPLVTKSDPLVEIEFPNGIKLKTSANLEIIRQLIQFV